MKLKKHESPTPVPQLEQLQPYKAQFFDGAINLKLDANEGPPLANLDQLMADSLILNRYPSNGELEQAIAKLHSVERDQVLVTAGGDESIDRIFRAYLAAGQNLVTTRPTFAMIEKYAAMTGANTNTVDWLGTKFPLEGLVEQVDDSTAVIAIVTPNNPTGQTVQIEDVVAIARTFPNKLLLIDQAYAEFEDAPGELTRVALNDLPNAIVIRSFSKAWGLAGIRVGYALAAPSTISNLRKVGGPYSVPQPSIEIAKRALQHQPVQTVQQIRSERSQLSELLQEFNCKAIPSQANFVLAIFDELPYPAKFVFRALAAQGVLVRLFEDLNALRITCPGDDSAFEMLRTKLLNILRPEAILFDMDGVLVDEAPSYRESIRATCEYFGETFTAAEIAELKLSGDANNDWIFTQRILAQRGQEIAFEEVKERFEIIYQGDHNAPGLWDREIQLVDVEWMSHLSQRYPLGIVTGRPRHDAVRFLRNVEIENLFSTIVCMEDGPRKPNPDNVITAMQQLGVSSAWMIGDTPDDINAARSAGIPAIGIPAPADDFESTTQRLYDAGATTVVKNLQQFGSLIP